MLTADPSINVLRVKSRVASGGHNVPEDKIISRYDKALDLVKQVVEVCDICHVYDNSEKTPFRIFKKRKDEFFYYECEDWYLKDIIALTGISNLEKKNLNIK